MTTFTTPSTPSAAATRARRSRPGASARVALWAVRALLAAQFALGGALKLAAEPTMIAMFTDIGAGQWLRVLVGALEVAAAVGLLVPRLHRLAAGGLVLLMTGATLTNLVVLQVSPVLPIVLGALAALVAAVRIGKADAR